jgi:hypothetical protein
MAGRLKRIRLIAVLLTVAALAAVGCTRTVVVHDKATTAGGGTGAGGTLPPAEGTSDTSSSNASPSSSDEVGATRENPIPVGKSGDLGDWTVKVIGYTPNADAAIEHSNSFNKSAKPGDQKIMVTLRATYIGNGSEDPYSDITPSIIPDSGNSAEATDDYLPKDMVNVGNIPTGASGIGNFAFEVKSSEVHSLVLYVEAYDSNYDTVSGFFALS